MGKRHALDPRPTADNRPAPIPAPPQPRPAMASLPGREGEGAQAPSQQKPGGWVGSLTPLTHAPLQTTGLPSYSPRRRLTPAAPRLTGPAVAAPPAREGERTQSPRNTHHQSGSKMGKRHAVNPRPTANNRPAPHTRPAAAHARRASTLRDPLWPLLHLRKEGQGTQPPRNTRQGGRVGSVTPSPTLHYKQPTRPTSIAHQLLRASFENWFKRRVDTAKPRAYSRASVYAPLRLGRG